MFTLLVGFSSGIFIFAPNSKGLITMGEILFFLSALLFEPLVGAFVGGVGFALADSLLGYPHYAVASLIFKASAGFIVGKLNKHKAPIPKFFSIASSLLLILLFTLAGIIIYSGRIYLGFVKTFFLGEEVLKFGGLEICVGYFPEGFWIIASIIITLLIFLRNLDMHDYRWTSVSLLSGCFTIVTGYFLYEALIMPQIFTVKVDAVANVFTRGGESILSATTAFLLNKIIRLKKAIKILSAS